MDGNMIDEDKYSRLVLILQKEARLPTSEIIDRWGDLIDNTPYVAQNAVRLQRAAGGGYNRRAGAKSEFKAALFLREQADRLPQAVRFLGGEGEAQDIAPLLAGQAGGLAFEKGIDEMAGGVDKAVLPTHRHI